MPVRLRCPGCQTAYQLPDTVRGKTVRCKSCSKSFRIPGGPAVATVGATAAPRKLAKDQAIKESSKKTKPSPPDDDDDEPVAPRRKGKTAKKSKEGKLSPMLLIGILVGAILVVGGVAVGAVMMFSGDVPKTAQSKKSGQPDVTPQGSDQKKQSKQPKQGAPVQDPKDDAGNGEEIPTEPVSYTTHIKPFLATYCGKCHGDEVQKGGANLQSYDALMKGGRRPLLTKGEPGKSVIVQRVEQKMKGMPPKSEKQPTAVEKTLLRRWIQAGAVDDSGLAGGRLEGFEFHNEAIDFGRDHALNDLPLDAWQRWANLYRRPLSLKLK